MNVSAAKQRLSWTQAHVGHSAFSDRFILLRERMNQGGKI